MLKRLIPFFKPDGDDGGWLETLSQSDAPADDEQPVTDSDAEDLTEEDTDTETAEETDDTETEVAADEAEAEPLDDDAEIDLGEGRQPVKLAELKQGYLRQSDYTKKTQALADERKSFDTEREQMAPVKQMSDFLNLNPYLREQIQQFITDFTQTGTIPIEDALADAAYGQYLNTLMAQVEQLARENTELKGKYGELEFGTGMDKTLAELRTQYGDLITPEYEQELRKQAHDENLRPEMVKRIAKGDLAEKKLKQSTKTAKQIEAETIQNIQEKRNALPINPRSRGQRPQTQTKSIEDMGWGDVLHG